MSTFDDCLAGMTEYEQNLCGIDLKPGISALALIDPDYTFTDIEDPTEWTTAISNGDVFIIRDGKGTYDYPAAEMVDSSRANAPKQQQAGWDHTLIFIDPNVGQVNDTFWKTATGRLLHIAMYNFEEQELKYVTDHKVLIVATPANDNMANGYQSYQVTATWHTKPNGFPIRIDAPTGIFE
jgi:hypothetical protein